MPARTIKNFFSNNASSGVVLMIAALSALVVSNTPLATWYNNLLALNVGIEWGSYSFTKPFYLWINDGLMTLFFFLVGLELKRECIEGALSQLSQAMLPVVAALGGMVMPVILYRWVNANESVALQGWAIPVATDIAFSLGVLTLLGSRIPAGLKVFLTALAVIDDLGAIGIIAVFHTTDVSLLFLGLALLVLCFLLICHQRRLRFVSVYAALGLVLWFCVLKSGVHATLAGVFLAFCIPMRARNGSAMLTVVEKKIHPFVVYGVMPLFAFANAGVSFAGLHLSVLWQPIPLGIILGLFVGKQLGVFLSTLGFVKFGFGKLPRHTHWRHIYGVSLLCGIGFTMSLFIGLLSFEAGSTETFMQIRLGVLTGSLLSGLVGYSVLRLSRFTQSER